MRNVIKRAGFKWGGLEELSSIWVWGREYAYWAHTDRICSVGNWIWRLLRSVIWSGKSLTLFSIVIAITTMWVDFLHRKCNLSKKKRRPGTSLVIQWLRLCASNTAGMGLIPGQGTKIPCTLQPKEEEDQSRILGHRN